MSNFSKEQVVFFNKLTKGFEDQLVISRLAEVVTTDQVTMARANDTFWRPNPYIATSYNGTNQTGNFAANTQMSVPGVLDRYKSAPFQMENLEMRDTQQADRLVKACKEKLASDINDALLETVCNYSTLFSKRSSTATGFDDVAQCDAIMNERGVPTADRRICFNSRDYNSAASNLQGLSRSFGNDVSNAALRRAYLGDVASFETYKLDYSIRRAAAAGGAGLTFSTTYTAGGSGNYWLPQATSASAGRTSNVDNRYQTVTVSSTTNVAAGDSFTVANVFSIHMISKRSTNQLMTFKVISVPSSTTLVISPPLINVDGTTQAEQAYGNIKVTSQSSTAAIVFLNTVAATCNPWWSQGAVEIYPGRIPISNEGGAQMMGAVTESGFQLVMVKFFDINTMKWQVRVDTLFGVNVTLPMHCGDMLFSQT